MSIHNSDLVRLYDKKMYHTLLTQYFEGSDFHNFGYWMEDTSSQKQACENLMEKLLAFIPERKGTILDVACGSGATTRYLLRYYNPSEVTGINISSKQLETCKTNAPGCTFLQMDASKLGFGDSVFDNIICVEAAFHFDTREDFLRKAWRVLNPGGHLVLSDILGRRWTAKWHHHIPKKNWVKDLEEYKLVYLRAGFEEVEVVDATKECWKQFCTYFWRWWRERFLAGEIKLPTYIKKIILSNLVGNAALKYYLLVSATKF